ncbi:MAG: YraN family protein, partial [Candidatus Omnitrophica bacterium]|nr:YraN family protein [Candidatus Omnitrophota bacterium]
FIEIKTRASSSLGPPYLAVTAIKKRHLIKNALYYLKRFELLDSDWRIDVVSVKMDREYKVEQMEVIENAVEEY